MKKRKIDIETPAMKQTKCEMCGDFFNYSYSEDFPTIKPHVCSDCSEVMREQAREDNAKMAKSRKSKRLLREWKEICPSLYLESDPEQLPGQGKKCNDWLMKWKYGPLGLWLRGDTGSGKTRLATMLLRRLHLEGWKVHFLTHCEFSEQSRKYSFEPPTERVRWFNHLTTVDVLLLDDLGKEKFTEKPESDLFNLVDSRSSNEKPMIVTSNLSGRELEEKMSKDRGEPLVRRLAEFTEGYVLKI